MKLLLATFLLLGLLCGSATAQIQHLFDGFLDDPVGEGVGDWTVMDDGDTLGVGWFGADSILYFWNDKKNRYESAVNDEYLFFTDLGANEWVWVRKRISTGALIDAGNWRYN